MTPEPYTIKLTQRITKMGVDCIIRRHAYVLSRCNFVNGIPVAFSLGNLTFTPDFEKKEYKPLYEAEYSAVFNLWFVKKENGITLDHLTFSFYKSVVDEHGVSCVVLLYDLIETSNDEVEREKLIVNNTYYVNKIRDRKEQIEVKPEYQI